MKNDKEEIEGMISNTDIPRENEEEKNFEEIEPKEVFEQKILKMVQSIVNVVSATAEDINELFK